MTRYLSIAIGRGRAPEAPRLTPARLADWCRRFTPLAAPDAPDGAMLDIAGAAHLFGGEAALRADIERRLATHGFEARAAVADTPEAAWALARHGHDRFAPAGADEKALRRLLGRLPTAALRLAPDIVLALSQSGLKCVDDLLMRPRAPIAARFGESLFARLDGMMGRAKSPITPRFEAPLYVVERRFAEPIARVDDIRGIIAALAVDLCAMLERHGEGARQLEASLFRVDGAARRIAASASRPLREPATIAMLFDERVRAASERHADDPFDSGYGFDLVRLAAMEVEARSPRQATMPSGKTPFSRETGEEAPRVSEGRTRAAPPSFNSEAGEAPPTSSLMLRPPPSPAGREKEEAATAEDFADLVDRLGARLGLRRVTRLVPRDTHIPEFAVAMVPAAERRGMARDTWRMEDDGAASIPSARATGRRPPRAAESDEGRLGLSEKVPPAAHPALRAPTRPLRLFDKPEPVEALAEVPDGPPLRFRWRRIMHEVAAIEGPERIAPEWWRDAGAPARDYFRVEDAGGARFWLYREGVYAVGTPRPRWFMHGLFA